MIKIIIKEQATRAGTAAAGTQAIRSYYNPQTKSKIKQKEQTPVTDTQLAQPQQEPEQTKTTNGIPSNWKPEIGTEIELNGVKYKANANGGWLPNGIGLPIPKTSPIFSSLNTLAYNREQNKTITPTPTATTTTPLEPEDTPTEQAATHVTVEEEAEEINYKELYDKIDDKIDLNNLNDIPPFVQTTVKYLIDNSESFKQAHKDITQKIEEESLKIFRQFRFIKNVEGASKFIAGLFTENRKNKLVLEAIDPQIGIAILLGTFVGGGAYLHKYFKNKALVEDFQNTPEAKYLNKVGLLLLVKFIRSFIDDPNSINLFSNQAANELKMYMEQFKQSQYKIIGFTRTKLYEQIDKDLTDEAYGLLKKIEQLSGITTTDTISESIINRWKVLANIKNSEV